MLYAVPETDRFFNVQVLDGWTNTIAVLEEPGTYAIVRSGWQGTLPEGVRRVEAPTDTVWCIARIVLSGQEDLPNVYAIQDRMALLRVLLPMEKAKREQLLPALQQLRACICGALTQRGGLDTASESAAQIVASRSGSELLQASDSIQAAIDALAANASAGAVTGYLAMKLR